MAFNSISQNQDPNVYAQQYANQNGLTLDVAIEKLKELYSAPIQRNMLFNA